MKLDVLVVRAPQLIDEPASYAILPEGILLTTILEKNGFRSRYYNVDFLRKFRSTVLIHEKERKYFLKERKRKFLKLEDRKWLKFKKILKKYTPKIVIIYPHKTYNYSPSILAANLVKAVLPATKTIIWNIPGIYEYFISPPSVDAIVKKNYGDTEKITLQLIKKFIKDEMPKDIPNIAFKTKNGKIKHTKTKLIIENLDSFPIPDRDLVLERKYYPRFSFGWIEGGRGCRFKCRYCRNSALLSPLRLRNPETIIKEILQIYTKYHTREFYFYMSSFTSSRKWAEDVCKKIIEKKLNIVFLCYANPKEITPRLLRLMKKAGCWRIGIGVETASEKTLKLMNRPVSKKDIINASKLIKKEKICLETSTIIGFPDEKIEDIWESILFTLKLRPDLFTFPIFIPHPELKITKYLEKKGLIRDRNYYEYFSSEPKVKLKYIKHYYLKKIYYKYHKLSYKMNKLEIRKSILNPKVLRAKAVEYFFDWRKRLYNILNYL